MAWEQGRPGVESTIIGARTMSQLESNLAALSVTLDEAQREALDKVSMPTLGFPIPFLEMAHNFMHAGATVDGVSSEPLPLAPVSDEERYSSAEWWGDAHEVRTAIHE